MSRRTLLTLASIFVSIVAHSQAPSPSLKRIFDKPYIAGTRPKVAALSPVGSTLLYQWDAEGNDRRKLWTISTSGGETRQVLDSAVSSAELSPDGKHVAFIQDGDVFLTDPEFKRLIRLTKTPSSEGQLTWSPDSKLLAVVTNNIVVLPATHAGIYQLTQSASSDVSYWVIDFSPNSKRVLFAEFNREGLPEFVVPRYTEKHVQAPTSKRGFSRVRIGIAPVDTGRIVWLKTKGEKFLLGSPRFSPTGQHVLFEQFDTTRKHREMYVCDTDSGFSRLVYTEFDEKWIESGNVTARWSADGGTVFFTSERDGWNHIYSISNDSSDLRQLTSGKWEVQWFNVHPNGKAILFTGNKDDHAQQHVFSLRLENGEMEKLTSQAGTYESPHLSRNGDVLVCSYSDLGKPGELYSIKKKKERRLTHSIPKEFQSVNWGIREITRFMSRDSTDIPAFLYKPANIDTATRYPCVVFVHGAGYLQNVFRGWSYYYREFMFHTYLVNKGYVVFEVDYRGSAGYGRKYRTDVYMHLGGLDLQDELDGVEYLKRLGYIDSTRIGMYGGSYGGFLPLMALFTSPNTYACAAVLRAVTDWENYYHHNPWYTIARLGHPEDNPEAYKKSSPITYADSLTKPLLILHGMVDDNVFFQDAVQLVDKLQKSGKKFEMMMYPSEAHSFTQPESWYDEYRRIDEFFDRHLLNRKQ